MVGMRILTETSMLLRIHNLKIKVPRGSSKVFGRFHSSSSSSPSDTANVGNSEHNSNTNTKHKPSFKQAAQVKTSSLSKLKTNSIRLSTPTNIPSVPTTKYIDTNSLKKDIFFTGFRPILSPIKSSSTTKSISGFMKKQTVSLSWNFSACNLEKFDDYSAVPQFIVDKLVPFNTPGKPGNEIIIDNLKLSRLREENERKQYQEDVYEFLKYFRSK
ncbi:hypothetical protein WICMUC_002382 [Wickerhamomyces mucosus]|uniref:Uncharacterized protein n=1 Tax=Wickerhamomyces mucosus TaxID=1378264 RepID=A0A9P8TEX6_9ASCO|nr:hypothetical protein WICMUC_002382 [Wickerhamomyces mucosus]